MANGNLTTVSRTTRSKTLSHTLQRDFKLNKYKYLIILPIIVYLILFVANSNILNAGATADDKMDQFSESIKNAAIVISTLPTLCIYPFL